MSKPYIITCPHCRQEISLPYEDIRHHVYSELGRESVRKRKDFKEHLALMARNRRSKSSLHPKQQAILDLSKRQNLDKLKLREIADIVGITGKYRINIVWHHLDQLKKKGLLSVKRRMQAFPIEQI